ncbi:MAG TPA: farnesyl diphosphate synthase [Gemmataceae bacterium]|nr:farnesyl diphosphate synthase [Gemmataceae bacterium]
MSEPLRQRLQTLREQVDQRLPQMLCLADGCPASLLEAMRYSLLAPGKRLRPTLVILTCEACRGSTDQAMPAACAVEMVHAYSLVHDDLPAMDNDDLRRGQPTTHKKFGEGMAILAGDALLTLAFQVLASEYPPATAAAGCRELALCAGAIGMVGGQVNDLTWEGKIPGRTGHGTLQDLENVHTRKTGALFRACVRLGMLAAQGENSGGLNREMQQGLEAYAACFGLAFQVTDDLLDVESDAGTTGKRVRKDASSGKLTYPGLLGVEESRRRLHQLRRDAEEALRPLGDSAKALTDLMAMIVERSN